MEKLSSIKDCFNIKNACIALISVNLASIVLGLLYFLLQGYNIFWDFLGVFIMVSFFGNVFLIHKIWKKIDGNTGIGNRINLLFYGYLIFSVFSMPLMFLGNFLISNSYSNSLIYNLPIILMVFGCYFGLLSFGIVNCWNVISVLPNFDGENLRDSKINEELNKTSRMISIKRILLVVLRVFTYIGILGSILFSYVILFGIYGGFVFGIFVPMMGVFFGFIFLSTTVILLKLTEFSKYKKMAKTFAIIGFFSSIICMLPYFSSPIYIHDAERNFANAFGADWRDNINPETVQYFMKTPFSLPSYFLGIQAHDCIIQKDILFYEETSGPNAGFKLHFDAYLPPNSGLGSDGNPLPGHNSTIIRVHGGAWVLGDKGRGNMMQMNKYFAAQGYVVFDIQYGLYNGSFTIPIITPEYKMGNFTMDELVNHTGEFTKYLGIHAGEYGADLSSVFISGGSAGGQLTLTMALAIHNKSYSDIFGSALTIKGIVPFYPANQENCQSFFLPGKSRCEFLNPGLLVDDNAPPCLIFQGTQDNLITAANSFKATYDAKENNSCAILYMPFAGHANDMYFSGYYNQVFLYYMERFLYIHR